MLKPKPPSRAAEAGLNLVENQKDAMRIGPFAERPNIVVRHECHS